MVEQISTYSLWKGPHAIAGGYVTEAVTPWGAHSGACSWQDLCTHGEKERRKTGAGLLAGLVTPWGIHAGAAFSWRTTSHGRDPHWGSSWRATACGKDSHWRSLWRTVSRERDLKLEQGKSVRSHCPEGQGAAERMCDEQTVTPIPYPPALPRGEEGQKREWSWAREEGKGGGKVF